MRVLIDGGNSGSGGYIRHLQGILSCGAIPSDTIVFLLCSPRIAKELGSLDSKVEVIQEPGLSAPSRKSRFAWWRSKYPELLQRVQPDVILYPSGYLRGHPANVPSVVMSQNLLPFDRREILRYGLSKMSAWLLLARVRQGRSYQQADGVIFMTKYAMHKTMRTVSRIKNPTVIYHGLDSAFKKEPRQARSFGKWIDLLYVSTIYLYKHQWHVVEATDILRNKLGLDIYLTLIGGGEPIAKAKLDQVICALNASSYVTTVGHLAHEELPARYREAHVFVFASSCETFGLPLLEAMGLGLPIACSERGPMPEILRDGGMFFDPEDPQSIALAIRALLEDPEKRYEYAIRAYEYAKEFTWEKCSEQTFAFLRSVAKR